MFDGSNCSRKMFSFLLQAGCVAVAALLQYFFTASFSWMLCEAIVLSVMMVVANFQRISKVWWLALFILGWGEYIAIPGVIYACCIQAVNRILYYVLIHDRPTSNSNCCFSWDSS